MAMKRVVLAIDGMTCINCQKKIEKKQRKVDAINAAGILSIIAMLYVLLQMSGVLNMLVPAKLADSGMVYGKINVI